MYLNEWMKKWLLAVLTCLLLIAGCTIYLFIDHSNSYKEPETSYVINQTRVEVNDLLLYIEEHYHELEKNSEVRNVLRNRSSEHGIEVLFSQLNGKVIFHSASDSRLSINIKHDLHYDLYTSKAKENLFNIAFPVVDKETQTQVGNAIFTIDKKRVIPGAPSSSAHFSLLIAIGVLSLLLISLLSMMMYKHKRDVIAPLQQLQKSIEEIVKGNYEPQTSYLKENEVGNVYVIFDQMRMEMKELHIQRDEQKTNQKTLISNISHDIKTPLTTIKAYLDAIHEGICPNMASVMEYVEIMQTNTQKMSRLIDDLLIHSLKELGHIPVYPKEQYSQKVLNDIIQPIRHYVQITGVHFEEPQMIPDVLIKVDEHRLEQVISNLMTNALKHTPPGNSISISAEVEDNQLKIKIKDTGEGILPQDMPFIFERYFRGMNREDAVIKNEGSGLGLSICKHIMEAHNGSILFKSKKNEGTVFTLSLPLS